MTYKYKHLLNGCLAELDSTLKNNLHASLIYFYLTFTFVTLTLISFISQFTYFVASCRIGTVKGLLPFLKAGSDFEDVNLHYSWNDRVRRKTLVNSVVDIYTYNI